MPLDHDILIDAWVKAGFSGTVAAARLGMPRRTYGDQLAAAMKAKGITKAALCPALIPQDLQFHKTTVQYDADGNVKQEWRRLIPNAEDMEKLAERLCKMVDGKAPPVQPVIGPEKKDLMLEIPIYDFHFGKYAWKEESGADFDLPIARKLLVDSVRAMCGSVPGPIAKVLLVIGGDFFHADTRANVTERGKHQLDVDTRKEKVWDEATEALHAAVQIASSTAKEVEIVVIPGNHDFESAHHLSRLLSAWYRMQRHISVNTEPRVRKYVRWGKVLLGIAHGHEVKMGDFALLMAQERPKDWAETTERVWHLGHIHHAKKLSYQSVSQHQSVDVEHLESLTSPDAWSYEQGFVGAPRRITGFLWDRKLGLRQRIYVTAAEMLKKPVV
jgi:hypothetical protein